MSGAVVKADWVVKSSGGKKEAASGAIEADRKESWKKRFLVLRAADSAGKELLSRFVCPLLDKYGTFIARCNALIEKVSPFIGGAGGATLSWYKNDKVRAHVCVRACARAWVSQLVIIRRTILLLLRGSLLITFIDSAHARAGWTGGEVQPG
eukprot:SAG31_NODE_1462_length_8242_cov_5.541135_10_plen_152_part_00